MYPGVLGYLSDSKNLLQRGEVKAGTTRCVPSIMLVSHNVWAHTV
jgi:hypothetical protein